MEDLRYFLITLTESQWFASNPDFFGGQIQDVWFSNPKFSFLNPNSWWLNQLNHHIPALEWSHFNLSVIKSRFWWPQGNPTHRCEKSTICRRFSYGTHGFSISFCTFTLGYLQFFIKSHSSRWRERPVLVRLPPVQGMWREQASVSGGWDACRWKNSCTSWWVVYPIVYICL